MVDIPFNWIGTIKRPISDGTRKQDIIVRLHNLNVEKRKTGDLPYELAQEKAALVEEYYQIERSRYEEFKKQIVKT